MESAFAWLGQIFEWLGKWVPRWVILDVTEGAVKYVGGKKAKYCGPGIHWYWPVTTTWFSYPIVRQADRLQTQTIVTVDDKTIVVGGLIVYSVSDLLKLLTTTHDPAIAVKDLALTAIHDVCCWMTWEELKVEQRKGTLDTKLKNATQRALDDYGVKVIKVMLTDLAPARVLKLMQSTSNQEN
jgi:regulator of protease activity HflC (stomatin/prohibitin superfamily)